MELEASNSLTEGEHETGRPPAYPLEPSVTVVEKSQCSPKRKKRNKKRIPPSEDSVEEQETVQTQ